MDSPLDKGNPVWKRRGHKDHSGLTCHADSDSSVHHSRLVRGWEGCGEAAFHAPAVAFF